MSYEIDRNLMRLNVSNLQLNRRQQLSTYLNVEQILMSDCGFARDYRGLAQQLDLSYAEIAWLEKQIDPFGSLLGLEKTCKLSVYNLFEFLVTIGRFDVVDDMIPLILEDLNTLEIRDKQSKCKICSNDFFQIYLIFDKKKDFSLRSAPIENETTIWYDAYVCYADQDLDFVQQLVNYLESPTIGFRLFIRDRDLLVGNWIYETFARLIEKQCRRMIIILSPDFLQSPECKFQSMFAAGLAIEKCSRILVPIIYKPCTQLPSMLRLMSKIDMSGPKSLPEWSLKRLIMSLQDQSESNYSTNIRYNNDTNSIDCDKLTSPFIPKLTLQEIVCVDQCEKQSKFETNQTEFSSNRSQSSTIINLEDSIDSRRLLDHQNSIISNDSTDTTTSVNDQTRLMENTKISKQSWIKNLKKKIKAL